MIVRELVTLLGFKLDQNGVNRAEAATRRLKSQADQAAGAFRNVVAAYLSFNSVRSVLRIADEMQSLRARIEQLPQTLGDAAAAFDEVGVHATKNRTSLEAYSKLYVRLGNAGKKYITDQKDLLNITDTVSQALVVGGASTAEAASVMLQFSQAIGSGVLQGDEFRAMAEAAPQYMDQLAIALGIPRENLKKMGSEGKLTSKQVIEGTRLMASYFEERFKKMPITVGQAMSIIGNKFALGIDKLNRKTLFVTNIANMILKAFDAIADGVDWLVDKFDGVENMLRFLGFALAAAIGPKVIAMLQAFRAVALTSFLPFLLMAAAVIAVALALEDLYTWIKGGDSLIGDLIGPWQEWRIHIMGTFEGIKAVFVWLGTMLASVAAIAMGIFTFDMELIKTGFQGVISLMTEMLVSLGKMIYQIIFDPIVQAIMEAWGTVKGLISGAWDSTKSVIGSSGLLSGTGGVQSLGGSVTPAQMTGPAMGNQRPSINNTTQVTVTVPPGTPAEQVNVINKAAKQSFKKESDDKLARSLAVFSL